MALPIRRKPGKKLSPEEREINRLQSKIRVRVENAIRRVKTYRIMGGRYRNTLKKYWPHQRHRVRTSQPEAAYDGGSGSLTETTRKIWARDV